MYRLGVLSLFVGLAVATFLAPTVAAAPYPLLVSADRGVLPSYSRLEVFIGRGFSRMAPGILRKRFLGPQNISLSHSVRSKTFTVSWTSTAGASMPCKLQFYTGSAWADVSSTASSPLNCGTNVTNQSVILNGDGWKSSWNGTSVRILRIADSADLGTFAQTLSCTTTSSSSSATPNIDEDCNGSWDNSVAGASSCNYCCTEGVVGVLTYYNDSSCTSFDSQYSGCGVWGDGYYGEKGCGPQDGKWSTWGNAGSCSWCGTSCNACGSTTSYTYY